MRSECWGLGVIGTTLASDARLYPLTETTGSLTVGPVAVLVSKKHRLVDWLGRLDRLGDDLEPVVTPDPTSVASAAAGAAGAESATILRGEPVQGGDSVAAVPLDDGSGSRTWLLLRFASPRDRPPTEVLHSIAVQCGAALRRGATREAEQAAARAVELRLAVADGLVGSLDAHAIAKALAHAIVPELADSVTVDPADAADDDDDLSRDDSGILRITATDGPTVVVRRSSDWTGDELALLDDIAELTRRALSEASIIDEQRRARSILERSLLPASLLPMPGLQLASRYLPAGRGQEAGGDFYDALRGPTGTTLIVGDVQGKGIEAATVTSLARHTLRAGALEGAPPAELLRQLNRALLYGQAEQALAGAPTALRFVTVTVAMFVPAGDGFDVVVARAGHPPPLIVRPAGEIELVEPQGVLLGVAENPSFEEVRVHLGLADTLVLYSDGVTEQRRTQSVFDEVQLGRMVRHQLGVVDAEALADAIRDTVLLVSPEEVRDDIAVLVACVK